MIKNTILQEKRQSLVFGAVNSSFKTYIPPRDIRSWELAKSNHVFTSTWKIKRNLFFHVHFAAWSQKIPFGKLALLLLNITENPSVIILFNNSISIEVCFMLDILFFFEINAAWLFISPGIFLLRIINFRGFTFLNIFSTTMILVSMNRYKRKTTGPSCLIEAPISLIRISRFKEEFIMILNFLFDLKFIFKKDIFN